MSEREAKLRSLETWAAAHIFNTFKVTAQQAEEHAKGMLNLIDAKGGDPATFDEHGLMRLIDETLSSFLEWKSEARRQQADDDRADRIKRYNDYINLSKNIWERKW